MRLLSVILPLLVITAVFIAPLQLGCCMSEKATPKQDVQEQTPSSCCKMQMTMPVSDSSRHSDQPLSPVSPNAVIALTAHTLP
ncbi:MAG: hypothetical protein CMJ19_09365 [Phycisphaeraceae bacterium]|nr:hypothetical protein [Phycisphaeraceae bacterium]